MHCWSLNLQTGQDLHDRGARRILVFSVMPVGCVPLQRTIAGGVRRKCAESTNHAAELFNSKLSAEVDSLTSKLADSRVAYIDWYTPAIDVIQNPKKYGRFALPFPQYLSRIFRGYNNLKFKVMVKDLQVILYAKYNYSHTNAF